MNKQELSAMMGDNQYMTINYNCCDCSKSNTISAERTSETEIKVSGGALFKPPEKWQQTELLIKCPACFEKDNLFYQETEVYSRVVGYLRPVKQWNGAKKTEFYKRKNFNGGA